MNEIFNRIKASDIKLFFWFNQGFNCHPLDNIMQIFTQFGSLPATITLPLLLLISGTRELMIAGLRMCMVLIFSQLIVHIIKRLVNRPRPYKSMDDVIAIRPPLCIYSFPSGHTCAAFSMALVLAGGFPVLAPMALIIAAVVGISRIYLGVHYPTDVLVGFLIAYGSFLLERSVIFSWIVF